MDVARHRKIKTFVHTESVVFGPETPDINQELNVLYLTRRIPVRWSLPTKLLGLRLSGTIAALLRTPEGWKSETTINVNLVPSALDPDDISLTYIPAPVPTEFRLTMPDATILLDLHANLIHEKSLRVETFRNYEDGQIKIEPGDGLYISLGIQNFPELNEYSTDDVNRIVFSYVFEYTVEYL